MKVIPATYAHFRFGREVLQKLPTDIKGKIDENIDIFNIGLHGPDILFYYRPYIPNEISDYGYFMHKISGEEFFSSAAQVCKQKDDKYLVYIYGFICHFVLDAKCHGFVEEYVKNEGVSHSAIETEFDRYNLLQENKKPLNVKLTGHIKQDKNLARIIAEFFGFVNKYRIYEAIKSYVFYSKILSSNTPFLNFIFKLIGKQSEFGGLVMKRKADIRCEKSNLELERLFAESVDVAVQSIEGFPKSIHNIDLFKLNFDSERREKSWDSN